MHGAKPLQDAEAQFIYDLAQLLFERGRVQLLGSPGPPAGVELAPGAPEVDADVTNGALLRVLLRGEGIEKPRFLGRSGADMEVLILCGEI